METRTAYPARAIRLRAGGSIAAGQDGRTTVAFGDASMQMPALSPDSRALLTSLAGRDLPDADAQQQVMAADGMPGLLRWQADIRITHQLRWKRSAQLALPSKKRR